MLQSEFFILPENRAPVSENVKAATPLLPCTWPRWQMKPRRKWKFMLSNNNRVIILSYDVCLSPSQKTRASRLTSGKYNKHQHGSLVNSSHEYNLWHPRPNAGSRRLPYYPLTFSFTSLDVSVFRPQCGFSSFVLALHVRGRARAWEENTFSNWNLPLKKKKKNT